MSRTTRWTLLYAILAGAAGLRLWRIDSLPPGFSFAEAYEGLEAWHILTNPNYHPVFLPQNNGVPPLNAYANALTFGLFHLFGGQPGPVAMRVTAACLGVLGVLALYALACELRMLESSPARLSAAFPFFAATTLAVMRWHIHFSRLGIEAIFVPLVWTGVVWLLLRGWRTGHWLDFVGSGIGLGAGMYTYQAAWIIPFLMILIVLLLLMQRTKMINQEARVGNLRFRQHLGLIITVVAALFVMAPLGWYAWHHLEMLGLRLNQVKIGSGIEKNAAKSSLWHNLWVTANVYNIFGDFGDHDPARNISTMPVLNLWLALPFYGGLGLAAWRVRRPGYALILISLLCLLLPGALSQSPTNFRRLLGATAPTALLCAVALDWLWPQRYRMGPMLSTATSQSPTRNGRGAWGHAQFLWRQFGWVSLLLLVLGGVTSAQEYFVRWAAQPELYDKFNTDLWEISQQIVAQPPDTPLYMTPRDVNHPTLQFLLQTHPRAKPIVFDGNSIFPLQAQASPRPAFYMIREPDDTRTRLLLSQIFPTAMSQDDLDDAPGSDVMRLYLCPANAVPQRPPQHLLTATLGDGITLLGYDVQPARLQASHILYLQLHWLVQHAPTSDWTVFTHLLVKDGIGAKRLIVGYDRQPGGGSLPASQWHKGWRILDEYQIKLPATLKPGAYSLEIGLYQANGMRLPAHSDGVTLGNVKIE